MFRLSNVGIIQTAEADGNNTRSCRFATVWTGMLNLSNKIFEKESRECYRHPTGITISELEYSWNSN
jgi:hypothetical protein